MSDSKGPEQKLFKATIDGIEIQVPPGTNIIQAAQKLGKMIPHFCYHPGLSVVGQCRMCFVEVEGIPKLQTACSTTVGDNMKILTESEKVKAGQNGTLEFTLLNHPLDCPICDRGGECKLQDHTYDFGPPLSRMADEKELRLKHRPISEEVILDQERCILCTRCVRFSSEVDGRSELAVNQRGHWNVIDVFENTPMKSAFSGNVVDLCPVGALTAKDFRFAARPWELKRHSAICTGCSVGCNIEIHTKHRHAGIARPDSLPPVPEVVRIIPRENAAINTWWMCDKGRWGYHFNNQHDSRLEDVQIRRSAEAQAAKVHLKEAQALLEEAAGIEWEFWIDDNLPHEGIAWAKELAKSWNERGRKVAALNPSSFGQSLLKFWAERTENPWFAGIADFKGIKKVVAPFDYRKLEEIAPILSLKLGQALRKGQIEWFIWDSKEDYSRADLSATAFLASVPKNQSALERLSKIPTAAKLLVLWTQANSRGLLNEGIAPLEALTEELSAKTCSKSAFYFAQTTQNEKAAGLEKYLSTSKFLVVADSFKSKFSEKARVLFPLTPLYETKATLTSLENHRQVSEGINISHPNYEFLKRGAAFVSPSLRLL